MSAESQPRVRGNDWPSLSSALSAPPETRPAPRSVSVVIPAYDSVRTLGHTLAALSVQSYPEHLLEVVVVDDGSAEPLTLPPVRPTNTRLLRSAGSWGQAHAFDVGVRSAEGDVVHRLDADMLPWPDEVESQMRWHSLIDYAVVLGHKTFVDVPDELPSVDDVLDVLREGRPQDLFEGLPRTPHEWVEEHLARTNRLTRNPTKSYLVHVGATGSVRRDLYLEAGGTDEALKLGEDIELGYRLAQLGAVFVPDDQARSWHLGRSTLMQRQEAVNRYNRPFITDRIADLRSWRTKGRQYTVPFLQVVVDAGVQGYDEVRHSVNGILTGSIADVEVVLLAPWGRLSDGRRQLLTDPDQHLRMLRAEFCGDSRVRFAEDVPPSAFPVPYRLHLPAGWTPGRDALRRLTGEMTRRDRGLVTLLMPDGSVGRLERTSAFNRARRLAATPDELDDVVDEVSGSRWLEAVEEGFSHASTAASSDEPPDDPAGEASDGRRRADRPAIAPPATPAPAAPRRRARARLDSLRGRALRRPR